MSQLPPFGNLPDPQQFQSQFSEITRKQMDTLAETQRQYWEAAARISQVWLDQAQSEAALISEFFGRLAAARSAPDATALYQEFANRQLQIINDSTRRMFKDSEDLLKANARLWQQNWLNRDQE